MDDNNLFFTIVNNDGYGIDLDFNHIKYKYGLNISNSEKKYLMCIKPGYICEYIYNYYLDNNEKLYLIDIQLPNDDNLKKIVHDNNPDIIYANMIICGDRHKLNDSKTYSYMFSNGADIISHFALSFASKKNYIDVVEYLRSKNADYESTINAAFYHHDYEIIKFLASVDIGINYSIKQAVVKNDIGIVIELIEEYGASLTTTCRQAVCCENIELIDYLITKNINIMEDICLYACTNNKLAVVRHTIINNIVDPKFLIDIIKQNDKVDQCANVMEYLNNIINKIPQELVDKDNTIVANKIDNNDNHKNTSNITNKQVIVEPSMTSLMTACKESKNDSKFPLVRLLVELKAGINATNIYKLSALHFAVQNENYDIVTYLLDHGANINHQDKYGMTSLMTLCEMSINDSKYDMVKLLLDRGACISIYNKHGSTIFDLIRCKNNTKIELLLKKLWNNTTNNIIDELNNDDNNWSSNISHVSTDKINSQSARKLSEKDIGKKVSKIECSYTPTGGPDYGYMNQIYVLKNITLITKSKFGNLSQLILTDLNGDDHEIPSHYNYGWIVL
ncbi:putative ankyrin repeat protein [Powai lake megavirus]|uniref:Putative ankyrin repeat protein n=1 Tax=Powai lake megavirus TaxID=1842663 RepID=A0A160EQW4_9VIRU|nr:putative ankyrin repeat protein [Powai lake megavirus]ANB51029.1 putative ankyrin repeat protein [Powai lake megavirus]